MTLPIDSQRLCDKEDKTWKDMIFSPHEVRIRHGYGKKHLFKVMVILSTVFAIFMVLKVNSKGGVELAYQIPYLNQEPVEDLPLIVVVTPTYKRPTRLADMTRLANTLSHVKNLHWIVIEDAEEKVDPVERLIKRTGLPYTYMAVRTASGYPKRGWYQRTTALNYLRSNRSAIMGNIKEGVLYFGDDDNSYDVRLFNDYLRNVKKVGLWAVGMVGGTAVESPDVANGKVIGFRVKWNPKRMFAVDMAGFGVNLRVVFNSTAVFGTSCSRGSGAPETCLLEDFGLNRADIEPFGFDNAKDIGYEFDILVWHTKTAPANYPQAQHNASGYVVEFIK